MNPLLIQNLESFLEIAQLAECLSIGNNGVAALDGWKDMISMPTIPQFFSAATALSICCFFYLFLLSSIEFPSHLNPLRVTNNS
jgi:hypothetical protein